jgi:hypothetical protein
VAIRAASFVSDRVLELHHALLARKSPMLDEAITKEFKSVYFHVDDFRLGRVQRKTSV